MGKTLSFPRQASHPPTPTIQTLWDKLETLDRIRPGALAALNIVADQFLRTVAIPRAVRKGRKR